MTKRNVLIAAGGTGGHLLPAQQLASQLQQLGVSVMFGGYGLEKSPYFKKELFAFREIASSTRISRPLSLMKGVCQAIKLILRQNPDVVVGFGSYHSAPLLVAAAILRKKIVLYEANRTMGKVNRWMAPFATSIGVQFPLVGNTDPKIVPVPLLPWGPSKGRLPVASARQSYGLDPDVFTLLVFGGSQGAQFLNEIMPKVAKRMGKVQVIHLAGNEMAAAQVKYTVPACVKPFETNMQSAYSAADAVVCRSGAGAIAELIRFSVPSLLIPYPNSADDHQRLNAEYLSNFGGAVFLEQKEASEDGIVEQLQTIDLRAMQLALRSLNGQNNEMRQFYELVLG